MTESAKPVHSFGSPIADRISDWLHEHPEATEYCINEELDAAQLLIAISNQLHIHLKTIPKHYVDDRRDIRKLRNRMQLAAKTFRGIAYIRSLNESGQQLEFLGVRITVPEEVRCISVAYR